MKNSNIQILKTIHTITGIIIDGQQTRYRWTYSNIDYRMFDLVDVGSMSFAAFQILQELQMLKGWYDLIYLGIQIWRCYLRKVVILWIIWAGNLKIKEGTGCRPYHQQGGQSSIAFNTFLTSIALRLCSPQVLELCPILTREEINPDQMYDTRNIGPL